MKIHYPINTPSKLTTNVVGVNGIKKERKKKWPKTCNLVPRALFPGFGGGQGPGKSALGTRLKDIRIHASYLASCCSCFQPFLTFWSSLFIFVPRSLSICTRCSFSFELYSLRMRSSWFWYSWTKRVFSACHLSRVASSAYEAKD